MKERILSWRARNIFMGDDGFGAEVVHEFRRFIPTVCVEDWYP
jgi:hypothetical protein